MGEIAIRAEGLSKEYRIGVGRAAYRTLRSAVMDGLAAPFRRGRNLVRGAAKGAEGDATIWALKGVSLRVDRGELVGIIGRNGAGKSTLLKILSRIVVPTEGYAEIHGRVGSLLEVGTGFHPELTGRENIALNGAILGMKRVEIARRFDEIVAFAEIEKFIDTPVKHYSSGMYLRLAFAVAAHLEPEILLVDEVLAVGDLRFEKKCIAKMKDVVNESRTVLVVSHNLQTVARLCERVILVDGGRVVQDGPAREVISAYLNSDSGVEAAREWPDRSSAPGGELARLRAVRVKGPDGEIASAVDVREPVGIEMEYEVLTPGHVISTWFNFWNEEELCIFSTTDCDPDWRRDPRPVGRYVSTVWLPGNFLAEGKLFVGAGLAGMSPVNFQCDLRRVVAFQVVDSPDGDTARGDWGGAWIGVVRPLLKWVTEVTPSEVVTAVRSDVSRVSLIEDP